MSLAHLEPWFNRLFPTPTQLIEAAKWVGFDFCMVLPMRGATGQEGPADYIRYYEGAWNAGTMWDLIFGRPGTYGTPPTFKDVLLFPGQEACESITTCWDRSGIQRIGHGFSTRFIEISPRLDMTPWMIINNCERTGCKLVVDTNHLQREYRLDEIMLDPDRKDMPSPLGSNLHDWLTAIEHWQPHLADVMHLNVNPQKFLDDQEQNAIAITRCWLEHMRHEDRYVVLEYRPPLGEDDNDDLAKAMLGKARELVG